MKNLPNHNLNPMIDFNHLPLASETELAEVTLTEDDDELDLAAEDDSLVLAEEDDQPNHNYATPTATLAEDSQSPFINPTITTWKVMIVDDDREIHEVTHLALQGFTFLDKSLSLLSAYSGQEAKKLLAQHPDTALILLDVVMEHNHSGLEVVKYIRETLQNKFMRIILRTGQPGEAPEESVILNYDINDYKLKTELTQRKLFTTLVAGLRAYHDLVTLEMNRRFAKQILETVPVGVTVHNADGAMYYANKRAIQLLGKGIVPNASPAELIEVYQLCLAGTQQPYPSDRAPVVLALRGQMASSDDLEVHQPTKIIPVETWSAPVYNEHGQITQVIVTFQDITERKQAEQDRIRLAQEQEAKNVALRYTQEIEAKNAALERLNRDKNEFLGIAAHDLKNPLSAIWGLADMIVDDFDKLPREEVIECAKGIILSAKQMFDLIVNLLDVNKIESGQFQLNLKSTDLLPLLQTLVNNYQDRAQVKQLTLHFQPLEIPWVAWVDQHITHQVLENLISNALKYSPPMTHIYIRLVQLAETVRCEIQDEGPGLSEKDQQKLFGKFARLTAQPTGGEHSTGLGLFIVKKLVTAMNGQVWCVSELGKGATFVVEFPKS